MDGWIRFWSLVLCLGIGAFVSLSVVVTIGGYQDIRSLFRSIDEQHAHATDGEEEAEPGAE